MRPSKLINKLSEIYESNPKSRQDVVAEIFTYKPPVNESYFKTLNQYFQRIPELNLLESSEYQLKWSESELEKLKNYFDILFTLTKYLSCNEKYLESIPYTQKLIYLFDKIIKFGKFTGQQLKIDVRDIKTKQIGLYGEMLTASIYTDNFNTIENYIQTYKTLIDSKIINQSKLLGSKDHYNTLHDLSIASLALQSCDIKKVEEISDKLYLNFLTSKEHSYVGITARLNYHLKTHYENTADSLLAYKYHERELIYTAALIHTISPTSQSVRIKHMQQLGELRQKEFQYKIAAYKALAQQLKKFCTEETHISNVEAKKQKDKCYLVITFTNLDTRKQFLSPISKDVKSLQTKQDAKPIQLYLDIPSHEQMIKIFNSCQNAHKDILKQKHQQEVNEKSAQYHEPLIFPISTTAKAYSPSIFQIKNNSQVVNQNTQLKKTPNLQTETKKQSRSSTLFFEPNTQEKSANQNINLSFPETGINYPSTEHEIIEMSETEYGLTRYAYIPKNIWENLDQMQDAVKTILSRDKIVSYGSGMKFVSREEQGNHTKNYFIKVHPKSSAQGKGDFRLYGFAADKVTHPITKKACQLIIFDFIANHRLDKLPSPDQEKYRKNNYSNTATRFYLIK